MIVDETIVDETINVRNGPACVAYGLGRKIEVEGNFRIQAMKLMVELGTSCAANSSMPAAPKPSK